MGGSSDDNDKLQRGSIKADPTADAERVSHLHAVTPGDKTRGEPCDIPAERALLGALLWAAAHQPDTLRVNAVLDLLEDGTPFHGPSHGDVYDAIRECATAKAEHDPVAVNARLVAMGHDRGAGGIDGLRALMNDASTVSETQARVYAKAIRSAWARRGFLQELRVLAQDTRDPRADTAQLVERSQSASEELVKRLAVSASTVSLGDSAVELVRRLESPGDPSMPIGLRHPDEVLNGGLRAREVSIIAADTNVGKSLIASQIAEHIVTSDETAGAVYVTLEMPHDSFTMRLVSARSGVPLSNMRKRVINPTQWAAITNVVQDMQKKGLYFADNPAQTLSSVYASALERSRLLARDGKRLRLLVIDHAGLVKPSAEMLKKANREQQVAETSRGLRFLATRLDCHVMALVQINRDAQGKNNEGVPKLRHLAESYALARDPDLVFILHRERDPKTGALSRDKPAAFVLAKGRMDESAVMLLGYGGARFYDHNGPETFSELYGR